jgi:hypothetical protein
MLSASWQWRSGPRDFEAARRLLRTKKTLEDLPKTVSTTQFSDFSKSNCTRRPERLTRPCAPREQPSSECYMILVLAFSLLHTEVDTLSIIRGSKERQDPPASRSARDDGKPRTQTTKIHHNGGWVRDLLERSALRSVGERQR